MTSWFNPVPAGVRTMRASPYIHFEAPGGAVAPAAIEGVLAANGVDATAPSTSPSRMRRWPVPQQRHRFPSRCEGGTNSTWSTCLRPAAIATFGSRHDALTDENSLLLRCLRQATVRDGDNAPKVWHGRSSRTSPRLSGRIRIASGWPCSARGAQDMTRFTWANTARAFLELLQAR